MMQNRNDTETEYDVYFSSYLNLFLHCEYITSRQGPYWTINTQQNHKTIKIHAVYTAKIVMQVLI